MIARKLLVCWGDTNLEMMLWASIALAVRHFKVPFKHIKEGIVVLFVDSRIADDQATVVMQSIGNLIENIQIMSPRKRVWPIE